VPVDRQHQLMRDLTLTLGGIVERMAEAVAGPSDPRAATALFELPSAAALAAARERRAVLVSVVLVDVVPHNPRLRVGEEPAAHLEEWIADRRKLRSRFVVTPWSGDPRLDREILDRLRASCVPFFVVPNSDLVGASLDACSVPLVARDEAFERDKLGAFWKLLGRAPAASVVCAVVCDGPAA
jgi:hypothetical protein